MTNVTPRRPQSLAEVQAGDEVATCESVYAYLWEVTRVTPTQIVIDDRRFSRETGKLIGAERWNDTHLSLHPDTMVRARKSTALARLRFLPREMTTAAVKQMRAACDAAEAALRAAGEWEGE